MIPVPVLETPRLILRPLELADAARTQELFPHWEIVRFLTAAVPWPFPADGAETYYRQTALPAMGRGEAWLWVLQLKDGPKEHIGSIGVFANADDQRGFWLGLPWQGKGLMTEAVIAANDFWFGTLGMPVLRAPKAVANVASRRVSERTGMRLVETTEKDYVSGRLPSELWEITAEEWARVRRGQTSESGPYTR